MAKAAKKVVKAKTTKAKAVKPVAKKATKTKEVKAKTPKAKASVKVIRQVGNRKLVAPEGGYKSSPVAVGDAPSPTRSRSLPPFVDTYGFSNLTGVGEFTTIKVDVDRDLFISDEEYQTEFDSKMKSLLRSVGAKVRRYKKEFGGTYSVYKSNELVVVKRVA